MRIAAIILCAAAHAAAQTGVPLVVNHHGRLLDPEDKPLAGPVDLTISFYELSRPDDQGNDPLVWTETYDAVPMHDGAYALAIGDPLAGGALALEDFPPGEPRWMEIKVNGDKLSPRLRVGSVPFALLAAHAMTAGDADHADVADSLSAMGAGSNLDADRLDGKDSAVFALASELDAAEADIAALETDIGDAGDTLAALGAEGTLNATTNPIHWTQLKGVPADIADGDQGATAAPGGGLQETGGAFSIATDAASLAKVSGGAMAASSNQYVGIGTSTPGVRLDVAGGNLRIDGNTGSILLDSSTADLSIGPTQIGTMTAHDFYLRSSGQDRITISSSGNVGVGTTGPADRLAVGVTSGTNPGVTVATSGTGVVGGATATLDSTSKGGRVWKLISESADNQGGAGSFALYDHTGGQNRITVTSTGDVGVGTNTPGAKLEVAGPIKVQKLTLGAANSQSGLFWWWTMTCTPRSIYYAGWPGAWGICICHEGGGSLMCMGS
jgi:hypothetical protein